MLVNSSLEECYPCNRTNMVEHPKVPTATLRDITGAISRMFQARMIRFVLFHDRVIF